jgi:hypothetical protein
LADTNTRARSSSTARSRRPLSSVAKVTYFLTDIADLPDLRTAVDALLPFPRPVASLVEVSALIDAKFRIEVEAIAPASELERPGSRPDRAGFSQLTEGDAMASAAANLGPDGRSAPSVGEVHRSLPVQQMLVAPLPHGHEHGEQGLALATEPVLVTGSRPRFPVGDLLQQTVRYQRLQAGGQRRGRDAKTALQVVEATDPVERLTHHQEAGAGTENL